MMVSNCFGRCVMNTRYWLVALVALISNVGARSASGDPAAEAPVSPQAEAAYQLEHRQQNWHLDPMVFTDLSPVSVPEVAIKLPADQQDDPKPRIPTVIISGLDR